MARAAGKKSSGAKKQVKSAPTRKVSKAPKPAKTVAAKTSKAPKATAVSQPAAPVAAIAAAPARPVLSEAERRTAFAESAERMRERLWAEQGQPLTTIDGVTIAFALLNKSRMHWHLLTFGLALDGLELSIRVQKGKDELAPPAWPVALLSALIARAKNKTLTADTNQVLVLSEGVAPGTESEMGGLIFTIDPDAGKLVTPHDKAPVLLCVPVTKDEVRAVREWSPSGLIEVLSRGEPLLISDLDRASLLQSPRARAVIDQRMEKEGSSLSAITAERSSVISSKAKTAWSMSPDAMETVISLLKGRTGHLRPFTITSPDARVDVESAHAPSFAVNDKNLTLRLSLVAARQLRSVLRAKPGSYPIDFLPGFEFVVEAP
ncbi:MAG: suppressor of fused domain protein [Archangium sp.]